MGINFKGVIKGTTVSYTHLDVYKRQIRVYVVNCFSMKNTHICGLCESGLFFLGLHIR